MVFGQEVGIVAWIIEVREVVGVSRGVGLDGLVEILVLEK
jgi:hypothetical protein